MRSIARKIISEILKLEARLVLKKFKPSIVAITGSVGKTATKDAIYCVVKEGNYVRKSEKSFNSEIGLPLTILGRPNAWSNPILWVENIFDGLVLLISGKRYPEWLILEVGADRPGDISSLASWLPVDIAVITRLPDVPVHVEFFESPDAVKEEKASLIRALKAGGALILFADDIGVRKLSERAPGAQTVTFGFSPEATVRAEKVHVMYENDIPVGIGATVHADGESSTLTIKDTLGAHAILPALAAMAVGKALGKKLHDSIESLENYAPPPGRMRLLKGVKASFIIDDTYNSSPAAAHAALETLELLRGRKIVVLGDMLELGRHSVDEHRKLGMKAATSADLLITVGFRARDIAEGALDGGMKDSQIFQYEDSRVAGKELEQVLRKGDVVLVKGSQSMRMERTVEEIMSEPDRKEELLVRQDSAWTKR
ncbi:MAG TPA: UDP-N-acetylmuramoyl-tripeptide--D-alanyl-D-alanine ligase [Candidatus Paceibacterota bacterium]|nr:UDP-N-acetylmuramoyl-tripeptide--D-alanyl-D-alanine ligase [Candidatus Paceibacterota bacterium]